MVKRLMNSAKDSFIEAHAYSIQCRYLRKILLKAYKGVDPLGGGFLPAYVFDMQHGNRRLIKRLDLSELYRCLLLDSKGIAMTAKGLLAHSEAASPQSIELVGHYVSLTVYNIEFAADCEAPNMSANELAHQCFCIINHLMELLEILGELTSEVSKSTLASLVALVPRTMEADWLD